MTHQERHIRRRFFEAKFDLIIANARLRGYSCARTRAMIGQFGHVNTLKRLLNSPSNGKKMKKSKWVSFEHLAMEAPFRHLFTKKQQKVAWDRWCNS